MATTLTKNTSTTNPSRSRRKTVQHDELRSLVTRRQRSSFPADVKTERAYWLKQIRSLIGDDA